MFKALGPTMETRHAGQVGSSAGKGGGGERRAGERLHDGGLVGLEGCRQFRGHGPFGCAVPHRISVRAKPDAQVRHCSKREPRAAVVMRLKGLTNAPLRRSCASVRGALGGVTVAPRGLMRRHHAAL